MGHKHKHAERDQFIKKHYATLEALVNEGKGFSMRIQDFVNKVIRPELQYSDKSDTDQIWVTMRKAFIKYRKGLAGDPNFKAFK